MRIVFCGRACQKIGPVVSSVSPAGVTWLGTVGRVFGACLAGVFGSEAPFAV
jgi:hypothetical protein